jgi:hypothetical protein
MPDLSDAGDEVSTTSPSAPYAPTTDEVVAQRSRRGLLVKVLGAVAVVALLAGAVVVGHAQWQDHKRASAHERLVRQQKAFLDDVRRMDSRVAHDIAPTLHVLHVLSTPRAGDIYAARDAFASTENVVALDRDVKAVAALKPPVAWTRYAADLRHAVDEMHDAMVGMHGDRESVDGDFLANDLQSHYGGLLASGLVDWQQAITELFTGRPEKKPAAVAGAGVLHVAPTLTSWVFGIDRVCIADKLASSSPSSSDVGADRLRSSAAHLTAISSRIRRVPLPRAQAAAIRRDVLDRMRMLDTEARLLRAEADAIDRVDLSTARQLVDRMRTLVGGLPLLERGFRKYHAVGCGGAPGSHGKRLSA